MPVNLTMMGAAEWHRELVADFPAQGSWLHESKVVSHGRLPFAEKARLRRHELQMHPIAVTARLAQGQSALVDMANNGCEWRTGIICLVSALIEMLRGDVRFSPVLSVMVRQALHGPGADRAGQRTSSRR
jgi:hypothetical protein